MINSALIRIIMLGRPLLKGMGVDTEQLHVILWTKCTVDDRRPTGTNIYRKSSSKKSSGRSKDIILFVMGIFLSVLFYAIDNQVVAHAFYLTTFMVYVISSLITDFSNVLIDVRDHYFILPRPVSDKTVATARVLHILIYLSTLFLPISLPAVILVFFKSGIIAGLLFLVELAAAASISVFAVNIIYMLMLQFMRPQKFRDVIAYFQIAFSMFIFGSYVVFPETVQGLNLNQISLANYWFSYLLPPVWMAEMQHWAMGIYTTSTFIFTALALISPVLCLAATTRFLSGNYSNKLSMMGDASEEPNKETQKTTEAPSWSARLAAICTASPLEEMGFQITWKLTSRMREFKLRVYPAFAYMPLYFLYYAFVKGSNTSWAQKWHQLPDTPFYLFILYMLSYLSIILITHITRSKEFKAAWFYEITPNTQPGLVLSGMMKALFAKYVLPPAILFVIFIFYIWGFGTYLNVIFALINVLLIAISIAALQVKRFPFSEPTDKNKKKGQVFMNMFLMLLLVAVGFFQAFISDYSLLLAGLSVISATVSWVLFRTYKRMSWSDLTED